ncbi:MAG: oligosaccharide flippase family protein, partial [Candidatus Woesearchaeota archaeon]
FRAYEKMQYQALTELVGSAVVVFLAILALFYNRGLLWVMVAHVIGALASIALAALILQKKFFSLRLNANLLKWKCFAREGMYFWLAFIMALLVYNVDMIMLFSFRGSVETGIYKAAYSVVRNTEMIPPLFALALYPALVKLIKKSKTEFVSTYKRSLTLMTIAALALTATMIIVAGPVIRIVYGKGFLQSVPVLRALSLTVYFFLVGSLNSYYMYAAGRQKQSTIFQAIGIALTIILGLLLIPRLGIGGAVFACVAGLGINYLLKQTYVIRMNRSLIQHG